MNVQGIDGYWSSTTDRFFVDHAWSVYFSGGYTGSYPKGDTYDWCWCVRGGQ